MAWGFGGWFPSCKASSSPSPSPSRPVVGLGSTRWCCQMKAVVRAHRVSETMYLHVLADVGRCSLCRLVSLIYGLWSSYAAHCPETGISEICRRRPCARAGLRVFLSLQELHLVWMSLSEPCLFFFWCNIYLVCYLRGEHTVCSKALMRINQMEGEREWSNLLLRFFF